MLADVAVQIKVIGGGTMANVEGLQGLGVSRVSLGPRPMRILLGALREIAREIRSQGSFDLMSDESISYDDVNSWFTR